MTEQMLQTSMEITYNATFDTLMSSRTLIDLYLVWTLQNGNANQGDVPPVPRMNHALRHDDAQRH